MSALPDEYRAAMRNLATGVVVISTRSPEGHPLATTLSAVTSVSLAPPLLLACLGRDSETLRGIKSSGGFVINVLGKDQEETSTRLAQKGGPGKLKDIELASTSNGAPCLATGPAWIACRLTQATEAGDHEIVLGEVTEVEIRGPAEPLLHFEGRYHNLGPSSTDAAPRPSHAAPVLMPARAAQDDTVAIVGGGASGTLTAIALLRDARGPVRVILIEARERMCRGLAYDTDQAIHRLNVAADQMGAFPDDPGHFFSWVRRRDPTAAPGDYLPRSLFGDYLEELLGRAEEEASPGVTLERVYDTVTAAATRRNADIPYTELTLASGDRLRAGRVVLALGNLPPVPPPGLDPAELGDRYLGDPWDQTALHKVAEEESALILGTGLTMVDTALSLAHSGGPVLHAVSRHGMLPRVHRGVAGNGPSAPFPLPDVPLPLAELVPMVIARCASADQQGADWRDVVDSLRPHIPEIWRGLSETDRDWFLTRLGRVWEVHRHRLAPEAAAALDRLRLMGRLRIRPGRVLDATAARTGVDVEIERQGGGGREVLRVAAVINCTGPRTDLVGAGDPLLDSLAASGEITPGPHGIGFGASESGRLYDTAGAPSPTLFTLGPNRRGMDWESTAIPEIRMQACQLAWHLAETMHGTRSAERVLIAS